MEHRPPERALGPARPEHRDRAHIQRQAPRLLRTEQTTLLQRPGLGRLRQQRRQVAQPRFSRSTHVLVRLPPHHSGPGLSDPRIEQDTDLRCGPHELPHRHAHLSLQGRERASRLEAAQHVPHGGPGPRRRTVVEQPQRPVQIQRHPLSEIQVRHEIGAVDDVLHHALQHRPDLPVGGVGQIREVGPQPLHRRRPRRIPVQLTFAIGLQQGPPLDSELPRRDRPAQLLEVGQVPTRASQLLPQPRRTTSHMRARPLLQRHPGKSPHPLRCRRGPGTLPGRHGLHGMLETVDRALQNLQRRARPDAPTRQLHHLHIAGKGNPRTALVTLCPRRRPRRRPGRPTLERPYQHVESAAHDHRRHGGTGARADVSVALLATALPGQVVAIRQRPCRAFRPHPRPVFRLRMAEVPASNPEDVRNLADQTADLRADALLRVDRLGNRGQPDLVCRVHQHHHPGRVQPRLGRGSARSRRSACRRECASRICP